MFLFHTSANQEKGCNSLKSGVPMCLSVLFAEQSRAQSDKCLQYINKCHGCCRLKRKKEDWRMQEEEQARRIVEPRDPVTGDTCFETSLRDQLERTHLQEVLQEREDKRNKQLEMTRSEVKTVQKMAHQRIFLHCYCKFWL